METFPKFSVSYQTFQQSFPKIIQNIDDLSKNKRKTDHKLISRTFDHKNLGDEEKNEHTLFDCSKCMSDDVYSKALGCFYVPEKFKSIAKKNGITIPTNEEREFIKGEKRKENLEEKMKELVPSNLLAKYKKEVQKETVNQINESRKETSVLRCFGGGLSINKYNAHRLKESFETADEALVRSQGENKKIKNGEKKPKKHVGKIENYNFDQDECLDYVRNLENGTFLNFAELARKFKVRETQNMGQVIKTFLIEQGIDLSRFSYQRKREVNDTTLNVRRKLKKIPDTDVSVSSDPPLSQTYRLLHDDIEAGKYSLGEVIVPQKFKKCLVTEKGEIKWEEFSVGGRKVPFLELREKIYHRNKLFYRYTSEEEIVRQSRYDLEGYLSSIDENIDMKDLDINTLKDKVIEFASKRKMALWHDGATLCNHSHILFTVNEIYDRAVHITDEEAKIKLGKQVNVQAEIQRPNMYMFVRCPGTEELTSYSETRLDDIKEIKEPLSNSFFTDEVRWFKGDAPSCQFESGHQKGGNYFCWLCGIKHINVPDYPHALYREYKTLKHCQDTVMCTVGSRKRSHDGSTKILRICQKMNYMRN